VQFGRPIGVNQAVKHACADMATRCEAASSLLFFAALGLREGRPDAAFQVAAAKRIATAAAYANARANVQIHGGMGFTWSTSAAPDARYAGVSRISAAPPGRSCSPIRRSGRADGLQA